jgi:hypothetical protein
MKASFIGSILVKGQAFQDIGLGDVSREMGDGTKSQQPEEWRALDFSPSRD